MPVQKQFGRRGAPQVVSRPQPKPAQEPVAAELARTAPNSYSKPADREPYDWNEPVGQETTRKYVKPPRAPWRTFVVVASVGLGTTSWLLPASVANITDVAFGILGAASFYVGYRSRRQATVQ